MISTFTVVIDSNVFFGARLRSLILYLALSGTFRARWTNAIHDEWIAAVLEKRGDITEHQLLRTRQLMDKAVPDCLVTGYEHLIPALELPDPGDRHVLAAAIKVRADAIVTFNFKDFPEEALAPFEINLKTPDDFILDLESLHPTIIIDNVAKDLAHYGDLSLDKYLDGLRKANLPKLADYLDRIGVTIDKSSVG